jgi:hypothetical protein
MEQKYKRQYRQLSDEVKQKISQATANRPKSADHKAHISQAMKKYWEGVPNRPDSDTTTDI